ncbi:MAG TPA: SpoIIE family protein phosphatase [Jatrophihabitans sp.]
MTDPSATVLVVHDSEGTRLVFADWLRRAGYTVVEAATGEEALSQITRTAIDLALVDVFLPDMSGLQVGDQIKSGRATAAIPVLLVSASAVTANDRTEGLNRGADGYLIEPIERDELLATVTALLRYHEARRTSERLASRLERLHESTLLMNAAPSVSDLVQYAATGLASMFDTPVAVLITRDGVGRGAVTSTAHLAPAVVPWATSDVLEIAAAARAGGAIDLDKFGAALGVDSSSVLSSPIATPRGELVGAVLLLTANGSPADELMLDHFAQAVAGALENQRLYAVEHQIALTLQRAMLPRSVPQPRHLEIAVRYLAASESVEIGGDFYDVIELDDERTFLAVGDVLGHSLQAATVMAELRHSMRALALAGHEPTEIVAHLDRLLAMSFPEMTSTLCIAVIHRSGRVTITNAGHIPPVVTEGLEARLVEQHGVLLGVGLASDTPTVSVGFPPGAELVMVTDGLIERRGEDLAEGLERLRRAVLNHNGPIQTLSDQLLLDVRAGRESLDDIAIVAARHRPRR